MKINHQIFYQESVSLRTVRFGPFDFSEDDLQSLVRLSKEVLRSNLLKSKKYWSAGHHVTRYLGRCLASCSGITHAWFLMKRGDNLTDWIWDLILSRKIFNIRTSLICSKSVLVRKLIFDFKLALYATLNSCGTSFFEFKSISWIVKLQIWSGPKWTDFVSLCPCKLFSTVPSLSFKLIKL